MSARFKVRFIGDVTVVDITGRLTLGEGAIDFQEQIKKLIEEDCTKIILNLAETKYFDSAGMIAPTDSRADLINKGGHLKLLALNKRIVDLLQITKLYNFFEIFEYEMEAVESFKA